MRNNRLLATLVSVLTCIVLLTRGNAVSADDEKVFSGPQPGERVPPLTVRNVFEEPAVDLDPVANAKNGPLLLIFVHKRERPAFGLTNTLLRYALTRKKDGLTSAAVFLTGDLTETAGWMRRIRNYFPSEATVTVSPDGIEGPGSFGLNREVTLTVLIARENRVLANFALIQPSLQADGPKIAKSLVDVLGGGDVPDLAKFSGQRMQDDTGRNAGSRNPAGRGNEPDPHLAGLLRQLIQKDATAEKVASVAKELNAYLDKNKAARKRVGEIASRIIDAGKLENYGTKPAQEHLKSWAKQFGPKPTTSTSPDNEGADRPKQETSS
ncbi:hypothetical protein GC176_02505 [bacterium]|nr:hypothetical protein [bacterium]